MNEDEGCDKIFSSDLAAVLWRRSCSGIGWSQDRYGAGQSDSRQQSRAAEPCASIERNPEGEVAAPVEHASERNPSNDSRGPPLPAGHRAIRNQWRGPLFEPAAQPGLAGATARLLDEGTNTRTSKQIAEQIDSMGASLSLPRDSALAPPCCPHRDCRTRSNSGSRSRPTFCCIRVSPRRNWRSTAVARSPLSCSSARSRIFWRIQTLNRALYGTFPAAVVTSTPESLDALTPAMLADWHDSRYAPQNT